jgi:hypothetical protein
VCLLNGELARGRKSTPMRGECGVQRNLAMGKKIALKNLPSWGW